MGFREKENGILRKGEVLWLMLPDSFRNLWTDFSRPAAECRPSPEGSLFSPWRNLYKVWA